MQRQMLGAQSVVLEVLPLLGRVEDHYHVAIVAVLSAVDGHYNQPWYLIRARVQEVQVLLDFGKRSHPEEARTVANPQQFLKPLVRRDDLIMPWADRRVPQQGLLDCPVATVVALYG